MSYHNLHITTATIPRTSIFDLPFNVQVHCTRSGGWQVWHGEPGAEVCIAGEYDGEGRGLRLDVAGHVIIDNLDANAGTRTR